jgi:hypothetical protein
LLKNPAQTVELINEMENDVDTFVIDSEVGFQIPDQTCPRNVHVGEVRTRGGLLWNEPPLLKPDFQRLHLETRAAQELSLIQDHDVLSSRGLNALP